MQRSVTTVPHSQPCDKPAPATVEQTRSRSLANSSTCCTYSPVPKDPVVHRTPRRHSSWSCGAGAFNWGNVRCRPGRMRSGRSQPTTVREPLPSCPTLAGSALVNSSSIAEDNPRRIRQRRCRAGLRHPHPGAECLPVLQRKAPSR